MLSWIVHYKNKYPNGKVISSENALDVYDAEGTHCVAIRKNGAGQWVCESEKFGLEEKHDLSPIPKDSRVHKVVEGKIGLDEKHEERSKKRDQFLCEKGRKVLSQVEFDKKQK